MAKWIKGLASKPDNLSSHPGTHVGKRKNYLPQVVLGPSHLYCGMLKTQAHTCMHNKEILTHATAWLTFEHRLQVNKTGHQKTIYLLLLTCNTQKRQHRETESRLRVTRDQGFGVGELLFNRSLVFIYVI